MGMPKKDIPILHYLLQQLGPANGKTYSQASECHTYISLSFNASNFFIVFVLVFSQVLIGFLQ